MNDFALPPEFKYRVKAATRALVKKAGGLVIAGEILGKGKSTVDRWGDPDSEDMIPVLAALALQQATGLSLVTQAMAELQGLAIAPHAAPAAAAHFLTTQARIAKEVAEYSSAVADAVADGIITPNEQDRIDREAGELSEALADGRNELAAAAGAAIHVFPKAG